MNTCDTCKWWAPENPEVKGIRLCKNPKLNSDEEPLTDGACIVFGDGYHDLATGPKFGCIHHEQKD